MSFAGGKTSHINFIAKICHAASSHTTLIFIINLFQNDYWTLIHTHYFISNKPRNAFFVVNNECHHFTICLQLGFRRKSYHKLINYLILLIFYSFHLFNNLFNLYFVITKKQIKWQLISI